jgi:hypothetical protein
LTTNSATVRFTMRTNLALTANFVDVGKPTVSLVTPTNNLRSTNAVIAMTGKASDNLGVQGVYYALNGSGWALAVTANGWTNWTANLALAPGTNTIQAYAVDAAGNASTTNKVRAIFLGPDSSTNSSSMGVTSVESTTTIVTLESAAYAQGEYRFEVSGVSGSQYVIEASTDLVNWFPVQTNTAPFTFTDTNAARFNQQFYRAASAP